MLFRSATPPSKQVTPLIRSVIDLLQTEVRRLATAGVLRGDTHDLGAWYHRQATPEPAGASAIAAP